MEDGREGGEGGEEGGWGKESQVQDGYQVRIEEER